MDTPTVYYIKTLSSLPQHWHYIMITKNITPKMSSFLTRNGAGATQEMFICLEDQVSHFTLSFLPGYSTQSLKKCTTLACAGISIAFLLPALGCSIAALLASAHHEPVSSFDSQSAMLDQQVYSAKLFAGASLAGLSGITALAFKATNRLIEKKFSQDSSRSLPIDFHLYKQKAILI